MKEVTITDIAEIERAKKGKIYASGCSCIALSATKGEIEYMKEDGYIDTRYAVIIPDLKKINPNYLYIALTHYFPEFLRKHRTGINLQFEELQFLKIRMSERNQQDEIVNLFNMVCDIEKNECEIIENLKDMKKYYLGGMFVNDHK